MSTTSSFRFLALGDSYTVGTSVAATKSWPRQLLDALELGEVIPADTTNRLDIVAVDGWSTDELMTGIEDQSADLLQEYDLVSLLIGVNNQYRGQTVEVYKPDFKSLLARAIEYAGGDKSKVFVVSIPDYAFTPFGGGSQETSAGVASFNAAARAITEAQGVPFLNITPISQGAADDLELVASDELHPSAKQYARWVKEVLYQPVRDIIGA